MVDGSIIHRVSDKIYRQFPEVQGSSPETHTQGTNTLLIYSGSCRAVNGNVINRVVRVVVDPEGNIIKMTTSR